MSRRLSYYEEVRQQLNGQWEQMDLPTRTAITNVTHSMDELRQLVESSRAWFIGLMGTAVVALVGLNIQQLAG